MRVTYRGPHTGVSVMLPTGGSLLAECGVPVDVPDSLAARLLEQDVWEQAVKAKQPKQDKNDDAEGV